MIRFLMDENFDARILAGLLRLDSTVSVVRVQDVGLSGADDETVLELAAKEARLLLTHDRKTIPSFANKRVLAGDTMPGVVVVSASCPLRLAIDTLLLLAGASRDGEWEGQILSVP